MPIITNRAASEGFHLLITIKPTDLLSCSWKKVWYV